MPVHVTSEIGALRTVLVHSPGNELLAVTPSTRADFLYDDIVDADLAKREHRGFVQVLERFCEVLTVRDLLTEVLEDSAVRELIIRETLDVVPSEPLAAELRAPPPTAARCVPAVPSRRRAARAPAGSGRQPSHRGKGRRAGPAFPYPQR